MKKGKFGKLQYQIAFEFRSLKWFVLEMTMFSVFLELIYMFFKAKGIESNGDIYFHTFLSNGIWELLFYITMIVSIVGIAKVVIGEKKGYNSLLTIRALPIELRDIVVSKSIVSIISILAIYGSQILSFMFAWSLFAENVPTAKRASNALNYALVKDPFINACFPNNIGELLVNVIVLSFLVLGTCFLFYAIKTNDSNKLIICAMFYGTQMLAIILLLILKARIPLVHSVVKATNGDVLVQLAIIGIVYIALNVLTLSNMYKEFKYEI